MTEGGGGGGGGACSLLGNSNPDKTVQKSRTLIVTPYWRRMSEGLEIKVVKLKQLQLTTKK